TGADLPFVIAGVQDDTTVTVQAIMTFDESANKEWEALTTKAPLAVRANPQRNVAIDSPLADPTNQVTLTIAASQQQAAYTAYVRTLHDADFFPPSGEVLSVPVPQSLNYPARDVPVQKPAWPTPWQAQDAPQGNPTPGTGNNLNLAIGP